MKKDLSNLLTEQYLEDMAESHIECWKDRYWRKSKKDIKFDLEVTHDDSLELERVEEDLGRKLNDNEQPIVSKKFVAAVLKHFYK